MPSQLDAPLGPLALGARDAFLSPVGQRRLVAGPDLRTAGELRGYGEAWQLRELLARRDPVESRAALRRHARGGVSVGIQVVAGWGVVDG